MPGVARPIVQQDISAGMFRGRSQELIPPNGAYDLTNTLLDEDGNGYKRGGSTYRSTSNFGTANTFLWDGYLTPGNRILISSPTAFATVDPTTGAVTSLGGAGISSPGRAAALMGTLYLPAGVTYDGSVLGVAAKVADYYASVGKRLLAAGGAAGADTVAFSDINTPGTFGGTSTHRIPGGITIIGLEGLRDSAAVFTTDGIWLISGLLLNLTDAAGNVQHRVDQYSRDIVLWGNAGIAAWEGGLIVPALDAVWQISLGVTSEAPQPFADVSDPIVALYQDYVRRGYRPGQATVYKSHYLLPIVSAAGVPQDLLVCKLNGRDHRGRRIFAWSRLAGTGAQVNGLAIHKPPGQAPQLIGSSAVIGRVLNLSYFEPSGSVTTDADGSVPVWSEITRDFPSGSLNVNTITKIRLRYELVDPGGVNPTIQAYVISGKTASGGTEWGLFSWGQADWSPIATETLLPGSATLTGTGATDTLGLVPKTWLVRKQARYVRFKFQSADRAARLARKSLEVFVRSSGRL
jgi:hypothetical protein